MYLKQNILSKLAVFSILGLLAAPLCNVALAAKSLQPVIVTMEDSYFSPESITISSGQTVVWINKGEKTHNVKSDDGYFESRNIAPNGKYSFTFTKPGTYAYACGRHSLWHMGMVGKVVVK